MYTDMNLKTLSTFLHIFSVFLQNITNRRNDNKDTTFFNHFWSLHEIFYHPT